MHCLTRRAAANLLAGQHSSAARRRIAHVVTNLLWSTFLFRRRQSAAAAQPCAWGRGVGGGVTTSVATHHAVKTAVALDRRPRPQQQPRGSCAPGHEHRERTSTAQQSRVQYRRCPLHRYYGSSGPCGSTMPRPARACGSVHPPSTPWAAARYVKQGTGRR